MFGRQKHSDDADSDSDWDSLTGDPEPPSDNEPTPRQLQPAPPITNNNSPRTPIQNKRLVQQGTPLNSKPSSPATPDKKTPMSSPSNRPSQMYAKSGATSFVDRGQGVTSFVDKGGIDPRKNNKSPLVDSNTRRVKDKSLKKVEGINNNGLELNELDFSPAMNNPPYTDFQGALPKHELPSSAKQEQKKGKVKSSYIREPTPVPLTRERNNSNNSWDEAEEDLSMYKSTRQIKDTPHQATTNHVVKAQSEAEGIESGGRPSGGDGETCCVPYQKSQGLGYQYIFHHGRNHYLDVGPEWREPYMKTIGERCEKWMKYYWQEFFGVLGLIVDFVLIFILELIRFILRKILLRLLSGVIIMFSDNFLKPYLTVAFNSFIQPFLIFMWNVLAGLRNAISPLLDITREVLTQIGNLLRTFRLFELNWKPIINEGNHADSRLALTNRSKIQEV